MSTHYPSCLTLHGLQLSVHLGRWDEERARRQPIALFIKLFFPTAPETCDEDGAKVFCYDVLCAALAEFVEQKNFLHIEYLARQLFEAIRANMRDQMGPSYDDVRVWVRLHKFGAPIPALTGGASFVYTDLPEGVAIAHE